jgi:hypothetical protein
VVGGWMGWRLDVGQVAEMPRWIEEGQHEVSQHLVCAKSLVSYSKIHEFR